MREWQVLGSLAECRHGVQTPSLNDGPSAIRACCLLLVLALSYLWFSLPAAVIAVSVPAADTQPADAPGQKSDAGEVAAAISDLHVVASWDGGRLTSSELREGLASEMVINDALSMGGSDTAEKVARQLALTRILVKEARDRGLDKRPAYRFQARLLEERAIADSLIRTVRREEAAAISDEEVSRWQAANPSAMMAPEAVDMRRITISKAAHADAVARAQAAHGLLASGGDFVEVAGRFNDGAPAQAEVQRYDPQVLPKSLVSAIMELHEGGVSGPVSVADGFEIVKVERLFMPVGPEETRELIRMNLAADRINQRVSELTNAAAARGETWTTAQSQAGGSGGTVVFQAGSFVVTLEEAIDAARESGMASSDPGQLLEWIRQMSGGSVELAGLARSMGADRRPGIRQAVGYAVDKYLAQSARNAMIPEVADALVDESRLQEHYDKQWSATIDPMMEYDAIVVRRSVAEGASPAEREEADARARIQAESLIHRLQTGESFEGIAQSSSELLVMSNQRRAVNEGSDLEKTVAAVPAGRVASRPYDDFGGYCVIRVNQYQPRLKTPYEMAKPYIREEIIWREKANISKALDEDLLSSRHFLYSRGSASSMPEARVGNVTP